MIPAEWITKTLLLARSQFSLGKKKISREIEEVATSIARSCLTVTSFLIEQCWRIEWFIFSVEWFCVYATLGQLYTLVVAESPPPLSVAEKREETSGLP
jgi:hypothetical protein